jgi:hypothetical protein
VDAAVVRRLLVAVGLTPGDVYVARGKDRLLDKLQGYNAAAQFSDWAVVVDLDDSAECAPAARVRWLPTVSARLCFRIAVRSIESWLLADREGLARFLAVRTALIPPEPESEPDPKRKLIALAQSSRRADVRQDIVPRTGSGRSVGPAYTSRLIEFADRHWDPAVARLSSPSLDGLMRCLESLRSSPVADD